MKSKYIISALSLILVCLPIYNSSAATNSSKLLSSTANITDKGITLSWRVSGLNKSKVYINVTDNTDQQEENYTLSPTSRTFIFSNAQRGHSYTFIIKVGSSYKAKTIRYTELPLPPKKIDLYQTSSGTRIFWLRDYIYDGVIRSKITSTRLEVTLVDSSKVIKELPQPISSYEMIDTKINTISSVKVYYKSLNGDSDPMYYFSTSPVIDGINVVQSNSNEVTLSWENLLKPTSTSIKIQSPGNLRDGEVITLINDETSFKVSGLSSLKTYQFVVENIFSPTLTQRRSSKPYSILALPNQPTLISITPSNSTLALNWNFDNNISNYILTYKSSQDQDSKSITLPGGDYSVNPYILSSLQNGYPYTISLLGRNMLGESLPVTITATPVLTPSTPTELTLTPYANSIELAWNDTSTTPTTSFTLFYKLSNSTAWSIIPLPATARAYSLKSLLQNYSYDIKLVANGLYGSSLPTPTQSVTCLPSPYLLNLKSLTFIGNSALLSWSVPDLLLNNNLIQGYRIDYSIDNEISWSQIFTNSNDTQFAVQSLSVGTKYIFRVSAVLPSSSKIKGTTSNTLSGGVSSTPSYVTSLTSTKSGNALTLSWNPPVNAGFGELYFFIYLKDSQQQNYTFYSKVTSSSFTIPNLESGKNYSIKVTAINPSAYDGNFESTPVTLDVTF